MTVHHLHLAALHTHRRYVVQTVLLAPPSAQSHPPRLSSDNYSALIKWCLLLNATCRGTELALAVIPVLNRRPHLACNLVFLRVSDQALQLAVTRGSGSRWRTFPRHAKEMWAQVSSLLFSLAAYKQPFPLQTGCAGLISGDKCSGRA